MRNNILCKTVLALSIMILPVSSFAIGCNEQSAAFKAEGDKYFDMADIAPISTAEKKAVAQLSSLMKGRWLGEGSITECRGSVEKPRKVIATLELEANVSDSSQGALSLSLAINNLSKTTTKNETLKYFDKNSTHKIISINNNALKIVSKIRRKSAIEGYTFFVEELTDIAASKNSLTVDTTIYINGYFASETKRALHR